MITNKHGSLCCLVITGGAQVSLRPRVNQLIHSHTRDNTLSGMLMYKELFDVTTTGEGGKRRIHIHISASHSTFPSYLLFTIHFFHQYSLSISYRHVLRTFFSCILLSLPLVSSSLLSHPLPSCSLCHLPRCRWRRTLARYPHSIRKYFNWRQSCTDVYA